MITKKRILAAGVSFVVAVSNMVSLFPEASGPIMDQPTVTNCKLVLNSISDDELNHVKLSKVLDLVYYEEIKKDENGYYVLDENGEYEKIVHKLNIPEGASVVWEDGENFELYTDLDTDIDLTKYKDTYHSYSNNRVTLIIGSGRQLDTDGNTVYRDIYVSRDESNLTKCNASLNLGMSSKDKVTLSFEELMNSLKQIETDKEKVDFSKINSMWEYTHDIVGYDKYGYAMYSDYYYKEYKRGVDTIDFTVSNRSFIVGNGSYVLDPQNYSLSVSSNVSFDVKYDYEIYYLDESGERQKYDVDYAPRTTDVMPLTNNTSVPIKSKDLTKGTKYFLGINISDDILADYESKNIAVNIYNGSDYIKKDSDGKPQPLNRDRVPDDVTAIDGNINPTGKMLNVDMTKNSSGYMSEFAVPEDRSTTNFNNVFVITYTKMETDSETGEKKDTGEILVDHFLTLCASRIRPALSKFEIGLENKESGLEAIPDYNYLYSSSSFYEKMSFIPSGFYGPEIRYDSEYTPDIYYNLKSSCYLDDYYYLSFKGFRNDGSSYYEDEGKELLIPKKVSICTDYNQESFTDITEKALKTDGGKGYELSFDRNREIYLRIVTEDDFVYTVRLTFYGKYRSTGEDDSDVLLNKAPVSRNKLDPYFRIEGIGYTDEAGDKKKSNVFTVDLLNRNISYYAETLDTAYMDGYQTVVIADPITNDQMKNLVPSFYKNSSSKVKVYLRNSPQESDVSTVDFSNNTVLYSVATQNADTVHYQNRTKNYHVTVLNKQNGGAKLYVNGPSTRTVFFNNYYGFYHDIAVLNIGDAVLTHPKVELIDGQNVKLDKYWNIYGGDNEKLKPFIDEEGKFTNNIAKIRLLPDGEGEISGKLKISADGQRDVYIELTGHAGNPKIVTTELDHAVKFVPYSNLIQNDNTFDWVDIAYTLNEEESILPDGVELLKDTGEIYGTPKEMGEFKVVVDATFKAEGDSFRNHVFDSQTVALTLTVDENTNDNVFEASDDIEKPTGYKINQSIGTDAFTEEHDFVLTYRVDPAVIAERESAPEGEEPIKFLEGISGITSELFISNGKEMEFKKFWFNGVELVRDRDYIADPGSTEITIKDQTLIDNVVEGENTIAAEFRVDGKDENDLKRTAQNFRVELVPIDFKANILVYLIDESGKPIKNENVEIHSDVMTSKTNGKGYAKFRSVLNGSHLITALGITERFDLVYGEQVALEGNTIKAFDNANLMLTVRRNGSSLSLSVNSISDLDSSEYNDDEGGSNPGGNDHGQNTSDDDSKTDDNTGTGNDTGNDNDDSNSSNGKNDNSGSAGTDNGSGSGTNSGGNNQTSGNTTAPQPTPGPSNDESGNNIGTVGNDDSANDGNSTGSDNNSGSEVKTSDSGENVEDNTPSSKTGREAKYGMIVFSLILCIGSLFIKKRT